MKQYLSGRRFHLWGVGGVLTAALAWGATPALAYQLGGAGLAWGESSACQSPPLSQPFVSASDSNWYTLVPGQTPGSFTGSGWTLIGGAAIENGQTPGGGSVLDLPSGSTAISPVMCVASDYPTARVNVRNVVGGEGVQVGVSYAGTKTQDNSQTTGHVHGQQTRWTLSTPFNTHPGNLPGWQLVRFVLVPGGKHSDFQVYDFYVDPKMRF